MFLLVSALPVVLDKGLLNGCCCYCFVMMLEPRLHLAELCRRKLDLEGCLTLLEVLEIYKVSRKLPGSVQPFVVNVPDSSCMSEVFNILCTKSPVENILQ